MIVIVSNKQKSTLDNANIDAIKDLNGLFNVQDLINNFKNYFFTRMIIDATSIVDFTNPEVLKQLANGIGSEKLLILLPPKPEPPLKFLETLVNIGIYNFSTNIEELVKMIDNPYDYDGVNRKIHNEEPVYNDEKEDNRENNNISERREDVESENPDHMMNRKPEDIPQSARKNDIINLSDFVMDNGEAKYDEDSNQEIEQDNETPRSSEQPFNDINQVMPFDSNMHQNNNSSNNNQMTNNYNNGGNSFIGGNIGGFIGFDERKGLVVGFRNVTEHAGTTTLLYKLKETIEERDRKRVALVEIGSNDFMFFRVNDSISINENELESCLKNYQTRYDYVFVDLNNANSDSICDFVLYLIEPSKIKVNKLVVKNRNIFNELKGKYVVLNMSMLSDNEKGIFSQEANLPFYASVMPFNDRNSTNALDELISKINSEVGNRTSNNQGNSESQGFIGF